MHTPSTTPRPSIYFPYQVHPAWQPPPDGAPPPDTPVLISGGGPIGLTLALDLARHGVRCVLLEAEQQVSEGSRAIVFTRRSMEILQQVGVAGDVTAQGLPWRNGNSFYRGQRVFRMQAPHSDDDRFHPMINLQQQYLEQALVEAVQRQPLIELRWGQKLTQVLRNDAGDATAGSTAGSTVAKEGGSPSSAAPGVEVEIDTPFGPYRQRAQWLVACDGARSAIRAMLGLRLEGASYEGRFVIADIRVDLPFPTERRAYFDPDWNPGNTVLMHREPHGIWRIDYQLPPDESPEAALAPEALKCRIDAQLAMVGHAGVPWQLDWSSVYSARAMTLPDYRHHRVLLAGDAAHLLPIFGVRGANTGFQDAHNLGWKLAAVVRGLAGPALLPSYSHERVAAAREIVDEAGKSTRFMTPPTRGFRLLRDAVLSLSLSQPFVGPLFHWRTSRPHEYADSPLNSPGDDSALFDADIDTAAGPATGPVNGAPLPNVWLGADEFLLDHFGPAFWLLHVADAGPLPAGVAQEVAAQRARGLAIDVVALRRSADAVDGAARVIADADGRVAARLGLTRAGRALLVRPDQHVCARWVTLSADRLRAALSAALGHAPAKPSQAAAVTAAAAAPPA